MGAGSEIDMTIRDAPFHVYKPEYIREVARGADPKDRRHKEDMTPQAKGVLETLDLMVNSYNRDRSNMAVDLHDVRFYTSLKYDYDIKADAVEAARSGGL